MPIPPLCRRRRSTHRAANPARLLGTGLLLLAFLNVCGCTFFQDVRDEINYTFHRPDPLVVLRDSDSGQQRARAFSRLAYPSHDGAPPRDKCLEFLCMAAVKDRDPLCRLEAIRGLGHFKEIQAVEALEKAFDKAKDYPPDTATTLREQVLVSLGQTGEPSARKLLIDVARAGAIEDGSHEKLQSLDLRLTAIRTLGKFKQYDATDTLLAILSTGDSESDRKDGRKREDVALRDRAHQSLVEATGKRLPPDPKAWEALLHQRPQDGVAQGQGSKLSLVAWWPFGN